MLRQIAEYLFHLAGTPWAPVALMAHAYLESFILPVGHEFILIPVALAHPQWSFVFAAISTVASTAGILTGYTVGRLGGRPLLLRFISPNLMALTERELHKYDVWAIAIAIFTPFPDKVFAPVAGALHVNFKKMFLVSFLSRAARFFLVCTLLFFFGETIKHWILEYMGVFLAGLVAFIVLSIVSWKLMMRYLMRKEHLTELKE